MRGASVDSNVSVLPNYEGTGDFPDRSEAIYDAAFWQTRTREGWEFLNNQLDCWLSLDMEEAENEELARLGLPPRESEPESDLSRDMDRLVWTSVQPVNHTFNYVFNIDCGLSTVCIETRLLENDGNVERLWSDDALIRRPENLSLECLEYIDRWSRQLWEGMVHRLNMMIRYGEAEVYARPHSPLNLPLRIAPDTWRHFTIVDWEAGTAFCTETGEKLFSVHVVDAKMGVGVDPPFSHEEGRELLVRLYADRSASGQPPMTMAETEAWANSKGLSRAFARDVRRTIPDAQKLRAGEKKRDRERS